MTSVSLPDEVREKVRIMAGDLLKASKPIRDLLNNAWLPPTQVVGKAITLTPLVDHALWTMRHS